MSTNYTQKRNAEFMLEEAAESPKSVNLGDPAYKYGWVTRSRASQAFMNRIPPYPELVLFTRTFQTLSQYLQVVVIL